MSELPATDFLADPAMAWSVLDATDLPVSVSTAIRDADGKICDFRTEFVSEASERMSGIPRADQIGRTISDTAPEYLEDEIFRDLCAVVESGAPLHKTLDIDLTIDDHRIKGTYEIATRRFGDGTLTISRDVSDRQRLSRAQEEVFERREAERQSRQVNDRIVNSLVRAVRQLEEGDVDGAAASLRETLASASEIALQLRNASR